jgi:hypothetical protein
LGAKPSQIKKTGCFPSLKIASATVEPLLGLSNSPTFTDGSPDEALRTFVGVAEQPTEVRVASSELTSSAVSLRPKRESDVQAQK